MMPYGVTRQNTEWSYNYGYVSEDAAEVFGAEARD
jgi:hypothetical protein